MPAGRGHVPREVLFVLPSQGNRCPGLAVCAHAHQHCEIALQISLPWGNLWEAGRFSSLAERRDVGASSLRAGCAFGKCWWGTAHLWPVPMVQEGEFRAVAELWLWGCRDGAQPLPGLAHRGPRRSPWLCACGRGQG